MSQRLVLDGWPEKPPPDRVITRPGEEPDRTHTLFCRKGGTSDTNGKHLYFCDRKRFGKVVEKTVGGPDGHGSSP